MRTGSGPNTKFSSFIAVIANRELINVQVLIGLEDILPCIASGLLQTLDGE